MPFPARAWSMAKRLIAIVDDDEAVRASIAALLEQHAYPVKPFETAEALLEWIRPATDAIVITDIRMPRMDGMQLIEALHAKGCRQPVVVITGHGDIPLAVRAMKAGVADFFEKPFEADELVAAVRRADAGLAQENDGKEHRVQIGQRIKSLSQREGQVLQELVEGKSNKMIAAALAISPRTVEIYRANVMAKMQAASLSELVRMSIQAEAA